MKPLKFISRIKAEIMYRRAVMMADQASAKCNGDIFFVMPTQSGKLTVINRKTFATYKRMHLTEKDCKVKDLFKDCVYHTNCKSQKGRSCRKRKFLSWKGCLN